MLAWLLAVAPLTTHAADDVPAERARIAAERAAAERLYRTARAECAQRFVVTTCMSDVTRRHRETLESLRRQTLALDESERRQQAAARLEALDAKARARAASAPAGGGVVPPIAPTVRPRSQAPAASSSTAADADAVRAHRAAAAAEQGLRAQEAAKRAEERKARADDAAAHRLSVERREQERQRSGRAAPPLPRPPEAAASALRGP